MKPRRSASAPSAPEPEWANRILQRRGVLLRDPGESTTDVLCADVRGTTVLLAHLAGPRPTASGEATFQLQFADASGIFQLSGTVNGEDSVQVHGVLHPALHFDVAAGSATLLNRRSSYRVGVTLKGELAVFEHGELDMPTGETGPAPLADAIQERLLELNQLIHSRKRPCIVLDLSLGGARVAVPAPAPRAGQTALLDLALARGDVLRNISGTVVQGGNSGGRREFEVLVRLRFAPLPGNAERRLGRIVSEVQLQSLRRGVRDRR